jgi:hypothetical protein
MGGPIPATDCFRRELLPKSALLTLRGPAKATRMFVPIRPAFWLALTLLGIACLTPTPASAERRVALVIGNAAYKNTQSLINPKNDAEDMAAALTEAGFEVTYRQDLERRKMDTTLAQFTRSAREADVALFYYAGHGMQFNGQNYLMPVDAELEDQVSLRYEMISLDDVRNALQGANGVKVMILDACRNNPLAERLIRSIRGSGRDIPMVRGFSPPEKVRGMVIAYSTQSDDTAEDGKGRNSPFTEALLEQMRVPGLEIGAMFRRVTNAVYTRTGRRQVPEVSMSLLSDAEFSLNRNESDTQAWTKIRDSSDPAKIKDFLQKYPGSFLIPEANLRLSLLEADKNKKAEAEGQTAKERQLQAEIERIARERQQALQELARAERQMAEAAARQRDERARAEAEIKRREEELRKEIAEQKAAASAAERDRLLQEKLAAERRQQSAQRRDEQAQQNDAVQQSEETQKKATERLKKLEEETDRLKADVPKIVSDRPGVASRDPAEAPKVSPPDSAKETDLVRSISVELKRVGCYLGATDGANWSQPPLQKAVVEYARLSGLSTVPEAPNTDLLENLRQRPGRVCPLVCSSRQIERAGHCLLKTCRRGEILDQDGDCVPRYVRPAPKPAPRVVVRPPRERQVQEPRPRQVRRPVASVAPARAAPASRGKCFSFNGRSYCE